MTDGVMCQLFPFNVATLSKKSFICEFSTVWADRADLGSTETAEQKLKYVTFEDGFFSFSGSKKKVLIFF